MSKLNVFLCAALWAAPLAAAKVQKHPPVEVKVEVTEIDHRKASDIGIKWLDDVTWSEASPAGVLKVGAIQRATALTADLKLMMEEGAAELLANPNLITDSGTAATFQAGGQIPYITSSSLGTTHVEFKDYGVVLRIEPTVLDNGMIEMNVRASVSAPDATNAVSLSGNTVPGLFEREVTSHITVKPGSTITLAGLVQNQKEQHTQGVPLLRSIPLLGALFRHKVVTTRKTTIVMFMTPKVLEL